MYSRIIKMIMNLEKGKNEKKTMKEIKIKIKNQDKKMGELEGKLAQSAAGFLGKQMEQ